MKIVHLETYLFALEDLAEHWELINKAKYAYRQKNYGIYNSDLGMIPHRKPEAPYFSRQTLLSSCMKPYGTSKRGTRITKAGKAYLQHAASLQVHFLALTSLIKNGLSERLVEAREIDDETSKRENNILSNIYNWFTQKNSQNNSDLQSS